MRSKICHQRVKEKKYKRGDSVAYMQEGLRNLGCVSKSTASIGFRFYHC